MIRTHYDNLDDYNADIEAARTAYAADMAVQNGLCAVCQVNLRSGHPKSRHRRCGKCKDAGRAER